MIDKSNKNSSSQELEQYGIWVKSEPQDIEEPEEMAISAETDQELTFETVEELESPLVIETLDDFTAAPETSEFENEFNEKTQCWPPRFCHPRTALKVRESYPVVVRVPDNDRDCENKAHQHANVKPRFPEMHPRTWPQQHEKNERHPLQQTCVFA